MICPQCGYDMGKRNKCLRCGYEVKDMVVVDEKEQEKNQPPETKVIDPNNTYLTDEYGNPVGEDNYSDPLDALFGSIFGDPIADILGGLFGINIRPSRQARREYFDVDEQEEERDEFEPEVVVDVDEGEIFDENGEPIKHESKFRQTINKVKQKFTEKNKKKDGKK